MTKDLVTGGAGFIGRHLVNELAQNRGHEVVVLDYEIENELFDGMDRVSQHLVDIRNIDQHHGLLEGVDAVYHLAGLLGTTELYSRVVEAEEINVLGTVKLLEAMREHGVERILYTSKPNMWRHNIYTITKTNGARYVEAYDEVYGFDSTIVKPYNVYGPDERLDIYRKAVPYFIVAALQGDPLEVFGSGRQTMDLLYVDDAARMFADLAETDASSGETVELGSGEPVTVNALAEEVVELVGSESPIEHVPMREGEDEDSLVVADTSAMNRVLGIPDLVPRREGLLNTIKHYEDNLEAYSGNIYEFDEELAPRTAD